MNKHTPFYEEGTLTKTKLGLGDPPANGGGGGGGGESGGERGGDGNNIQGTERTKDRVSYVSMLLMLHSLDACMHTHTMLFLFILIKPSSTPTQNQFIPNLNFNTTVSRITS